MLKKIEAIYSELTERQKTVAKYILEHPELIPALSAAEFAHEVGVSDATIVRFAQSVGLSGFTELKNCLKEGLRSFEAPYQRFLQMEGDLKDTDPLILQSGKNDLERMESLLLHYDRALIAQAVEAIYAAKRIFCFGRGAANCLLEFLILHLRRMGFYTTAVSEGGAVNSEKMLSFGSSDLLMTVCFPLYSKSTYEAILFAKARGGKVLSITDSASSLIGVSSDIALAAPADSPGFFNSYIVPLALCNILLTKLFERSGGARQEAVKKNMQELEGLTPFFR